MRARGGNFENRATPTLKMEVLDGNVVLSCRRVGSHIATAVSIHGGSLWIAYPEPSENPRSRVGGVGCSIITLLHRSLATQQALKRAAVDHGQPVEALALSSGDKQPLLLCSASHSSILLWNVDALTNKGNQNDFISSLR